MRLCWHRGFVLSPPHQEECWKCIVQPLVRCFGLYATADGVALGGRLWVLSAIIVS